MDWAAKVPWGIGPVPELYVEKLQGWKTLPRRCRRRGGDARHHRAMSSPGHTPGHLLYLLKGSEHDVIFTGDAAKNRAELLCGKADVHLRPGRQHGLDCGDLDALAQAAGQCRRSRA